MIDKDGMGVNISSMTLSERAIYADRLLDRAGELAARADAMLDLEEWEKKEQGDGEIYDVVATAELYANLANIFLYSVEVRKGVVSG